LRLWRYADRWVEGGPGIAAWLSRVAMNLCLDRLRKTRRNSDEDVPELADGAPLADASIESDEVKQAVIDCIQSLPGRQRASIILTYYEQLSNGRAADSLKMNIKAFESMLYRARRALKGCVEGKNVVSADVERIHP
ncbi:sigma-70 family RNA polymerase sigma factor, partial [Parasphingorhabdus sp.]|uniref:sigma-70 family RNA polymerase sigma factor n=1 Tax=Parasphingorhabdus sp. TaxID=2709688 RepID=UPI003C710AAE